MYSCEEEERDVFNKSVYWNVTTMPQVQVHVHLYMMELGGFLKTSLKENNFRLLTFQPEALVVFRAKVYP